MASALHVVIVDDQPDSVANVASHLENRGHRVEVIAEPLEALRRIGAQARTREPFQLLLCDVNLPNLDGPGLVRELRRRGDNVPAVFITGYHSMATRLRSELAQLKVLGILTKPAPTHELDRLVEQAMRQLRGAAPATQAFERPAAPGQPGQDRRASEFGSGGHRQVGGAPIPEKEPFYGTSRTFRARFPTPAPTEGILSQVERPAPAPDIIPDEVFTGRYKPPPAPPRQPPAVPPSQGPSDEFPAPEFKEPTGFYPTTAAPVEPPSGPQRRATGTGELSSKHGPLTNFRDPVTGEIRRPSGIFPAEPSPMDPLARNDGTGRIQRAAAPLPPGLQAPTGRRQTGFDQPSGHTPSHGGQAQGNPPSGLLKGTAAMQPGAISMPPGHITLPPGQTHVPGQTPASGLPHGRTAGDSSSTRRSGTWTFSSEAAAPPGGAKPPAGAEPPITTSRYRRSVGQPPAQPPLHSEGGYSNPGTSRIRRSIGQAPQPAPPISAPKPASDLDRPSCTVACAHCGGEFTVAIKPESYTVICVHCGKLNRIDPL